MPTPKTLKNSQKAGGQPAPAETIYLIPQAARVLGCGERTLIEKIKANEIRAKKKLRKWYLLHSDLVAYINS